MHVRTDAWLEGPEVERIPSRRYGELDKGPLGICWHTTDVAPSVDPRALALRIASPPGDGQRSASWHLLLTRDGRVLQSVPFDRGAWHVRGEGLIRGLTRPVNGCLVGIELENCGRLRVGEDGDYRMWPFHDDSPRVAASRGCAVGHLIWDGFPSAQVDATVKVVRTLAQRYCLSRIDCSYTHAQFDTNREDPGQLWIREILPALLGEAFAQEPRP